MSRAQQSWAEQVRDRLGPAVETPPPADEIADLRADLDALKQALLDGAVISQQALDTARTIITDSESATVKR